MARYKLSFYWQQTGNRTGGWSENFWVSAANPDEALTKGEAIRPTLLACHGRHTLNTALVARFDGKPRQTKPKHYPATGLNTANSDDSDYQTTAVCIQLTAGLSGNVRQWLRGIGDNFTFEGGRMNEGSAQWDKVKAFCLALAQTSGFICRLKDQNVVKKEIVSGTAGGIVEVMNHGYTNGQMIQIQGVELPKYANGLWRIAPTGANTFQLVNWSPRVADAVAWKPGGTTQLRAYVDADITAVDPLFSSSRKVGRPFGLLTGRRKSRR